MKFRKLWALVTCIFCLTIALTTIPEPAHSQGGEVFLPSFNIPAGTNQINQVTITIQNDSYPGIEGCPLYEYAGIITDLASHYSSVPAEYVGRAPHVWRTICGLSKDKYFWLFLDDDSVHYYNDHGQGVGEPIADVQFTNIDQVLALLETAEDVFFRDAGGENRTLNTLEMVIRSPFEILDPFTGISYFTNEEVWSTGTVGSIGSVRADEPSRFAYYRPSLSGDKDATTEHLESMCLDLLAIQTPILSDRTLRVFVVHQQGTVNPDNPDDPGNCFVPGSATGGQDIGEGVGPDLPEALRTGNEITDIVKIRPAALALFEFTNAEDTNGINAYGNGGERRGLGPVESPGRKDYITSKMQAALDASNNASFETLVSSFLANPNDYEFWTHESCLVADTQIQAWLVVRKISSIIGTPRFEAAHVFTQNFGIAPAYYEWDSDEASCIFGRKISGLQGGIPGFDDSFLEVMHPDFEKNTVIVAYPDVLQEGDATATIENPVGDAGEDPGDGSGGDNTPTCEGEFILGWVLCPVVTTLLEWTQTVVDTQLEELLFVESPNDNPDFAQASGNFRAIANSILVVVLLVLIFAQSLSIGLDAYTIKKSLPRLFFAVIGMQLALPIMSVFIDIFNVLGLAIADLILGPVGGINFSLSFSFITGSSQASEILDSATELLAGAGLVVGGILAITNIVGIIWVLIASLPAILLTLFAVILTLVFRKLIIIALAILAPLAFVAWVLPNTQKIAKEWFDTFLKALAMFPIITAIIAIGGLMATITTRATPDTETTIIDTLTQLIATFGPYALIPFTYRFAGKGIAAVASGFSMLRGRAGGGAGGHAGAGKPTWQQRWKGAVKKQQTQLEAGAGLDIPGLKRLSRTRIAGSIARGGSIPFLGGAAKKSSKATQAFRASAVVAGARELQEAGLAQDQAGLRAISRYGTVGEANQAIRHMRRARGVGENEFQYAGRLQEATELENTLPAIRSHLGKVGSRAAAGQLLAQNGWLQNNDFAATEHYLGSNRALLNQQVESMARTAYGAGQTQYAGARLNNDAVNPRVIGYEAADPIAQAALEQMSLGEWERTKHSSGGAVAETTAQTLDALLTEAAGVGGVGGTGDYSRYNNFRETIAKTLMDDSGVNNMVQENLRRRLRGTAHQPGLVTDKNRVRVIRGGDNTTPITDL